MYSPKKRRIINKVIKLITKKMHKLPGACQEAGISINTWYFWERELQRHPPEKNRAARQLRELRQAAEKTSQTQRVQSVIDANFKSAINGNVAAQCFFLKNNAGWTDAAMIDQSQHSHFTYVWKKTESIEGNSNTLRTAGISGTDTL